MKRNQKLDPNQLQLWKDFMIIKDELQVVLDRFLATGEALIKAGVPAKEVKKATVKVVDEQAKETRERINSIVRHLAHDRGLHWKELYLIIYRRLRESTGFDAISAGLARNKSPIETVQKRGLLKETLAIAAAI